MASRAESDKDQEAPLDLETSRSLITPVRGRFKGWGWKLDSSGVKYGWGFGAVAAASADNSF